MKNRLVDYCVSRGLPRGTAVIVAREYMRVADVAGLQIFSPKRVGLASHVLDWLVIAGLAVESSKALGLYYLTCGVVS